MAHNPTVIIDCSSDKDPKNRIATLEKNRGNDIALKYSMYDKKLIKEPVSVNETENVLEQINKLLSFNIS